MTPPDHFLHSRAFPLKEGLHPSVFEIADPAVQSETASLLPRVGPEEDALDHACDEDMGAELSCFFVRHVSNKPRASCHVLRALWATSLALLASS